MDDMPDTDIAFLVDRFMRKIQSRLQAKSEEFDTERVGPGGGMILMTMAETGPVPIQEIVRRMARDKSQMTRALKSLESKGLIARSACDGDARVCLVRLSDKGEQTVARLQAVLSEVIGDIVAPLGEEDRVRLKALLAQI